MQSNVKIRRFLIVILFFLIICIPLLVYLISRPTKTQTFVNNVEKKVLSVSGYKELPPNIKNYLSIVNDVSKPKSERYQAMSMLGFAFSYAYTANHDPSIRKFSSATLDSYAKSQFPEYYNESDFNIPCADIECGQKLDPEMEKIIKSVKENNIPSYMKNTIITNLISAGYTPDSDLTEKKYGIKLAVDQLRRTGSPEASKSAETLVKYFKDKYKVDL